MSQSATTDSSAVDARRLFLGSCIALIATSSAFALVGDVMFSLKSEFVLSNVQIGWIGGAGLWGFAVSQLLFSPFCDTLGMRLLLRLAFLCHLGGSIMMMMATGFGSLFGGALVISMGNGLVEAACNPLVAALYPENKTVKLNQFHVWFPGGIVLAGLVAYGLTQAGMTSWQLKLALILVPTLIYGFLLLGQRFPETEGVQSGVSMGEMFKATFTTPLMLIMLACMALTASIELGPGRWVPAVLESGGMSGILLLVYINALMAILRYRAGDVVHRLSPTGILLGSAVLSGVGLLWMSVPGTGVQVIAAATVFALGVCYFWPTMLGFVSERVPRSGALGLGLMGTVGMATVGLITSPWMGRVADDFAHERLPAQETLALLQKASLVLSEEASAATGAQAEDLLAANGVVAEALDAHASSGALPPVLTASALRAVSGAGVSNDVVAEAGALLGPAENAGGLASFRRIVPLCGVLVVVFGLMFLGERRRGGYQIERLDRNHGGAPA